MHHSSGRELARLPAAAGRFRWLPVSRLHHPAAGPAETLPRPRPYKDENCLALVSGIVLFRGINRLSFLFVKLRSLREAKSVVASRWEVLKIKGFFGGLA